MLLRSHTTSASNGLHRSSCLFFLGCVDASSRNLPRAGRFLTSPATLDGPACWFIFTESKSGHGCGGWDLNQLSHSCLFTSPHVPTHWKCYMTCCYVHIQLRHQTDCIGQAACFSLVAWTPHPEICPGLAVFSPHSARPYPLGRCSPIVSKQGSGTQDVAGQSWHIPSVVFITSDLAHNFEETTEVGCEFCPCLAVNPRYIMVTDLVADVVLTGHPFHMNVPLFGCNELPCGGQQTIDVLPGGRCWWAAWPMGGDLILMSLGPFQNSKFYRTHAWNFNEATQ